MVGVLGKDELISNKLQNDLNELFNWPRNRVKTMLAFGNVNFKKKKKKKKTSVFCHE